jgi:hypothetical protein
LYYIIIIIIIIAIIIIIIIIIIISGSGTRGKYVDIKVGVLEYRNWSVVDNKLQWRGLYPEVL